MSVLSISILWVKDWLYTRGKSGEGVSGIRRYGNSRVDRVYLTPRRARIDDEQMR